jgi:hypothetical protein
MAGSEVVRWFKGPWGQMVVYLLIFLVLGFVVSAFFHWVRGPERSQYTPWDSGSRMTTTRK